jgi:DNA-directed RNA polymerase specialized sigma24 family protein
MKVSNLGHLDALFDRGTAAGLPDELLLERFAVDRDGPAFEAIVARHGPMVFNVCRRVLPNRSDVDDAFQATFLILVRKARAIRDREHLGSWLYGALIVSRAGRGRSRSAVVRASGRQAARRPWKLSDTGVTDACFEPFRGLKNLRYLDVRRTRVTEAGAEELRRVLPGLEIRP